MIFALGIAVLVTAFGLATRRVLSRRGAEFLAGIGAVLLLIGAHAAQWQFSWSDAMVAVAGLVLGALIWSAERPFRRRLIPAI
jgi:uncharacterized membrane protein